MIITIPDAISCRCTITTTKTDTSPQIVDVSVEDEWDLFMGQHVDTDERIYTSYKFVRCGSGD